jgi:hypothetical protein
MRWYLADNFYENNHFVKAVNQLGQLEPVKFPKGIHIRPITRGKKQIKSLVNLVVSRDPRWVIYPLPGLENELQINFEKNAQIASEWMDALWYFLGVKRQIRKLVFNGFRYNVGYFEVGGDSEGNIFLDIYEPYDIWHEPGITDLKETSWCRKAVSRTIEYVRTATDSDGNPLYDPEKTAKLQPNNRLALSEWKNIKLREQNRGFQNSITDPRVARVFLNEIWIKSGNTWDLITECDGEILREQKTELTELPIGAYSPQEGPLYQPSPLEDLMEINKALDILVAMVEGYARTVGVARLLKSKDAKVERILNEHGEMIEYEGAFKPEWMQPAPTPNAAIQMIQMLKDFMDEVGTSIISFGKVPPGIKAFKALESLQNAEFQNQQTAIDRLADTLSDIAAKIFDTADRMFVNPVSVNYVKDGVQKTIKLVSGSNSIAAQNPTSDATPISAKYGVKVEIESGLAYTAEGKRDTLLQLGDKGYLPKEEVLKGFKFSNVNEILEKLRLENAQRVSIVETPEFNALPPELRLEILRRLGVPVPANP